MAPHTLTNSGKIQNLTMKPKNHDNYILGEERATSRQFLSRGDTINVAAYCETLKKLRRAIQNKLRGILKRGVCLLHDNARPHTARCAQVLQSFKWEVLAYPQHSPDLAPSGHHLFSKLKGSLAERLFGR
jgi:transposase